MRSKRRLLAFISVALLLIPLLSGCGDTELVDELVDMGKEWGQEKGLIDENMEIEWLQVTAYGVERAVKGSTGDSTLDAALEAGPTVYTFHKADDLANRGLEEGNVALIDQAITMRPDDWSYYDKKAAVLINQGNMEEAEQNFQESEWLVDGRIENGGDCKMLKLNLYRNREGALLSQLEANPENKALLDALDETQGQIYYLESDHEKSPCQ